jgi:6-phosphogluconolactonase (cycloisomerase 2 family)
MRNPVHVTVTLVLVALIGGGCGGGSSGRKNTPPAVTIVTPAGTQQGNVTIDYTLFDGQADPVVLTVEYSTDGGATFWPATDAGPTAGSDGVTGLTSNPTAGIPHVFVWDSSADLPDVDVPDTRIQMTPMDAAAGTPAMTGPFFLNNDQPPTALVQTPASPASGGIQVDYTLIDPGVQPIDIIVDYSTDGGATFQGATEVAGPPSEGTSGLGSSGGGIQHIYIWDSLADVGPNLRSFVRIRISPSDPGGPGTPGETGDFTVDNTVPANRLYTLDIPMDPAGPDTVSGYDVDPAGALTPMTGSPWATGGQGRQMSSGSDLIASPLGDYIFASHNESAQIDVFEVGPAGALAQVPGSPFSTVGNPTRLSMHQSGSFIYASNSMDLEGFSVDPATGALTALPGSPFVVGSSLRDMVVHPRGDFIYTGHMFGADAGVRVHDIDPTTGDVTFSSWLDLTVLGSRPGSDVTVDPQGLHLFCSDLDVGIFVASIDPATGALTLAPGAPVSMGAFVCGMTATRRGDYLYVSVGITGTQLHGYAVDAAGGLTAVPGSPYANIGNTSLYLETDAPDALLFVSSRVVDDIRVYDIDPAAGSLTEVAGSPFANPNPAGIVGPLLPSP